MARRWSGRCEVVDGVFMSGCMGTAAACGCGKTLKQVMQFCTCEPRSRKGKDVSDKEELVVHKRKLKAFTDKGLEEVEVVTGFSWKRPDGTTVPLDDYDPNSQS